MTNQQEAREAFEAWIKDTDPNMSATERRQFRACWQAARTQGEELNDWLALLELPEGYEVEEFLPGIYHYTNTLDGVKMASGASWNHPALAAISAWQNTTPAVRAVDVDDAALDRAVGAWFGMQTHMDEVDPDAHEWRTRMRNAIAALTQPEAE